MNALHNVLKVTKSKNVQTRIIGRYGVLSVVFVLKVSSALWSPLYISVVHTCIKIGIKLHTKKQTHILSCDNVFGFSFWFLFYLFHTNESDF